MKIATAKGTRDFLPAEQLLREKIMGVLRRAFQRYGFRPLDTPAIESYELLSAKYAGGDEILNETFSFTDRGKRKLGLRYDLTVPLARCIAENPQLKFPFKRYQMSKVWRDGPTGFGRYREFWQCDIDSVGSSSMGADAEILAVAKDVFEHLRLKVEIKVNNRKLLNGIMDSLNVEKKLDAILIIDKMAKMREEELLKEFTQKGISNGKEILEFFRAIPSLAYLKKQITSDEGKEGLNQLEELFKYLKNYGVEGIFAPELARGLSYYTSTIYEVFIKDGELTSSVAGGGRYDDMIGHFQESSQPFPAVGISFGMDRIYDALLPKLKPMHTPTRVFVIPIGTEEESIRLAQRLRKAGIPTETDISGRGISRNLEYANSLGIPFVAFLGKQEIASGKIKLRDMTSGKETLCSEEELIKDVH